MLQLLQKRAFTTSLLVLVTVILFSCGTSKMTFAPSTIEPAARGEVKVKKDNNNNYQVDINVLHLAGPERLANPKKAYVVWMETSNGIQNLGQLKPDDGLFSKTIKANLRTTSPYEPRRVFITAEDEATVQYPGNYVVLNTGSL